MLLILQLAAGKCEQKDKPCGNYTVITDAEGKNALKGVVAFEGNAPDCKLLLLVLNVYALTNPLAACLPEEPIMIA